MGTWICHLRIADRLLEAIPGLDEAAFIYGNLAPDSGIPNENWTKFDPPKEVTHFLRKGQGESQVHDLVFYRDYLQNRELLEDPVQHSFRLGYHTHLVCDLLWSRCIGSVTQRLCADEISRDAEAAWDRIKDDWYGLDQLYNRAHPEGAFWRVVQSAPEPAAGLPFLNEAGLHHQLQHIREFYGQPEARWFEPRPYPYLNEATMSRMVTDSVEAILLLQKRLAGMGSLDGYQSSAAILPAKYLGPYGPPLGDETEGSE